ncbi:Uncharacterised protein [Raoultella ornithinolytica]|nr:Uncharacterised protein [Raoultella ornithinolytica]
MIYRITSWLAATLMLFSIQATAGKFIRYPGRKWRSAGPYYD